MWEREGKGWVGGEKKKIDRRERAGREKKKEKEQKRKERAGDRATWRRFGAQSCRLYASFGSLPTRGRRACGEARRRPQFMASSGGAMIAVTELLNMSSSAALVPEPAVPAVNSPAAAVKAGRDRGVSVLAKL